MVNGVNNSADMAQGQTGAAGQVKLNGFNRGKAITVELCQSGGTAQRHTFVQGSKFNKKAI